MKELSIHLEKRIVIEKEYFISENSRAHNRMGVLEQMIVGERDDRIFSLEE